MSSRSELKLLQAHRRINPWLKFAALSESSA